MTMPETWLMQFLQQRDLLRPDGRKLFGYRLDEHEYVVLRDLVGKWLGDNIRCNTGHLARGTAELFVLYGAAWWQREYAGGTWRWDDVMCSFGSNPDTWQPQFRSDVVQIGLQYWKQRIPPSGKRYFGVLVEQGGLPRVLLAKSKGNIVSLIRAVLKRAARLGAEVDEIALMVADYRDKLPKNLQNDAVHLVIAQIVATVLDLKREFKLNKGSNPVERLDKLAPQWRRRFPVALDDHAAMALLSDLVGDAVAIEAQVRVAPVVTERLLVEDSGVYSLVSRVEFPKQLLAEVLAGWIKVEESSLPFRFQVDICLDKQHRAADVRRTLGVGSVRFQFSVSCSQWRGDVAMREHLLRIALPGRELVSVPVPGGMEMNAESPWVFISNGEDECRLEAQGSTRVRQDFAFLVIDDAWEIVAEGLESVIERLGSFSSESLAKSVFKVIGVAIVSDGTHTFRIQTRQAGAETERPVWEGRRLGFISSPTLAFYGTPKLYSYSVDGQREIVPAHQLEWRVAGTSRVVASVAARGPVDVLWRVNGELRLRSRLVVLDHQSLRFQSGASVNEGRINIPAVWAVAAVTGQDKALVLRYVRTSDWLSVDIYAANNPPESVRLTLDWKGCPVPLFMDVPFPASGGRFVDSHENRLDTGATITRDQLLGVRLHLFDANPDHPVQHKLIFTLHHTGLERLTVLPSIEHCVELQDNRAEVRLFDHQSDIDSLLSHTDALDAIVNVTLWAGRKQAASLLIKRYEFALIPDGASVAVSPPDLARLSIAALSTVELFAIPIESMHSDAGVKLVQQQSEGVPSGRWSLPANAADHQWLIYPATDLSYRFRAVMIDLGRNQVVAPTCYASVSESVQEIWQISDPARRLAELVRWLNEISQDYAHPDWQLIEGIWCNIGHLTLPTLDIWRAFAMNHTALAAFVCRYWERASLDQVLSMCGRFQSELGVLWETVPFQIWNDACAKVDRQYWTLLPKVECATRSAMINHQLGKVLSSVRLQFPALNTLLAVVAFKHNRQAAEIIAPLTRAKLQDLKARLWHGPDAAIQTILLRNSADREPPSLPLYGKLINNLQLPDAIASKESHLLWDAKNPKAGVANMPVLLAICSCTGALNDWWRDPKYLIELRQYRDFDRDWFSHAFDQAVAMCIVSGVVSASPMTNN